MHEEEHHEDVDEGLDRTVTQTPPSFPRVHLRSAEEADPRAPPRKAQGLVSWESPHLMCCKTTRAAPVLRRRG